MTVCALVAWVGFVMGGTIIVNVRSVTIRGVPEQCVAFRLTWRDFVLRKHSLSSRLRKQHLKPLVSS